MRADHHFGHFKLRAARLPEKYPVSKRFEAYKGVDQWVWRLEIPLVDDPSLAVLVGDILFNVRSALDHLAVGLIPSALRRTRHIMRSVQFPIFTCDIDERDPLTGHHLHRDQRRLWDRQTRGFATPTAQAAIKWHQPYQFLSKGLDPRDSSLAILRALQNADKHRQLVVVARGIRDPVSYFSHSNGLVTRAQFDRLETGFLGAGTVVDADPNDIYADVKMEVEGTPEIFIGESWLGPYRDAASTLRSIIENGWVCAQRLEPLVED